MSWQAARFGSAAGAVIFDKGHLRHACGQARDDAGDSLDLRTAAMSGGCFRRLDERPRESFSERFATETLAAAYWKPLF